MEKGAGDSERYELHAGRWIYRDGKPFVAVQLVDVQVCQENFEPIEADRIARDLVVLLNIQENDKEGDDV